MSSLLKAGERLDDLNRNGYKIIQDPKRFCFGMDAVLLSSFAKVKSGEVAMDFCTGTGVIPILLEARTEGSHFTGMEIQEDSADMAHRSVIYNHLEEKVTIITGDIKDATDYAAASSYDVVTCNPPYMIGKHGLVNPESEKAIARHEILCTLEDVVKQAAVLLRPGGRFYMVHRPFRLPEIMAVMMKYRIEPKRMRLVYPYIDKEPNMVLIEGSLYGNPRMTVERPLIVYKKNGVYTEEIVALYNSP